MTVRARGTSFGNRQECLEFIKQFRPDNLSVTLEKSLEISFIATLYELWFISIPFPKRQSLDTYQRG